MMRDTVDWVNAEDGIYLYSQLLMMVNAFWLSSKPWHQKRSGSSKLTAPPAPPAARAATALCNVRPLVVRRLSDAAWYTAVLSADHPQVVTLKHCQPTTLRSNSEALLIVAQGGGGGASHVLWSCLGRILFHPSAKLSSLWGGGAAARLHGMCTVQCETQTPLESTERNHKRTNHVIE